jgi:hypothetical protein
LKGPWEHIKTLAAIFGDNACPKLEDSKFFLEKIIYSGWRLYGIQLGLHLGQESSLNMALDVTVHKGVKDFLSPNRETDYGNLTTCPYVRIVAV